jgi:hypothetical protein
VGVEAVKITRYPEVGAGVAERDGEFVVGLVPVTGELQAAINPTRMTAG